jgi:low temperature requirement protein LtrA
MVVAVIAVAVAVHKAVGEPNAAVSTEFSVICLGGPALYLVGIAMSKRWLGHGRSRPPMLGAAALLLLGIPAAFGSRLSELLAAAVVVSVMSLVSARDYEREPVA